MKCIDEGVLQAYNDGELSTQAAGRVAAHLAACETCNASAQAAAGEFAAFAAAFSVGESLSVPTERLRANLAAAIAESGAARATGARAVRPTDDSFAARLRALVAALAPRQAAAFAGLALAALLAGIIFYTLRPGAPGKQGQPDDLAAVKPTPTQPSGQQSTQRSVGDPAPQAPPSASPSPAAGDVAAGVRTQVRGGVIREAKVTPRGGGPRLDNKGGAGPKESLLPVEREYLTDIASLESAIEQKGAATLSPTLRAEYARSLAVVDQAIVASRNSARTNPQDADAQEFLRTAYRDKLDLLTAVADRAQLAGLER